MMRIVLIVIALCSLLWTQHVMAQCEKHYKIGVHFNLYHDFVTVEQDIQNHLSNSVKAKGLLKTAESCTLPSGEKKVPKSDFLVECEIMKIKEEIASNVPHREKGNECLDLVVSTEMHWNETEYASGKTDFSAYVELAKILQEHGIKMSLSLGVQSVPDWVEETEYASDKLEHTHALRYKPDSPMWEKYAKPWVEAAIGKFSEEGYIGQGKVIEEIMISNEVMYTHTTINNSYNNIIKPVIEKYPDISCTEGKRCAPLDDKLTALLHQWYKYVKTKVQGIPVTWRIAQAALNNNNLYTGIVLSELVDNDEYIPDFFAINVYEFKDNDNWNGENWYTFSGSNSDFYNTAINPVKGFLDQARFIYFSEFGNGNGRKFSLPIERVILRTKKDGVTHWAFFGWNVGGNDNITPEEKKGLKTAFGLFFFPDVDQINPNAMNAIAELVLMGVIKGHPNGTFAPKDPVNRAEFSKMIYLTGDLLGFYIKDAQKACVDSPDLQCDVWEKIEVSKDTCKDKFHDVKCDEWETTWYVPFIYKIADKKVVEGYQDNTFRPEKTINFAEVAKMVTRGFKFLPHDLIEGDIWYNDYVNCANKLNLLSSYTNGICLNVEDKCAATDKFVTREETALMINNAYFIAKERQKNNEKGFVCQ